MAPPVPFLAPLAARGGDGSGAGTTGIPAFAGAGIAAMAVHLVGGMRHDRDELAETADAGRQGPMIDEPAKTARLFADLQASVPVETRLSPPLVELLQTRTPDAVIPARCNVLTVFYMGDEGGISCALDIGGANSETQHIVSITHLLFDRRIALYRQIEAYQRHRVKKLKQQDRRDD